MSLVEPDGTFSYVNPTFATVFGYRRSELIGQSWKRLYHNEEAERLEHSILPEVAETGYWSGETVRLTKHGDRRITDHRLAKTESGSIVCTAQDLTEERVVVSKQRGEFYHLFEEADANTFYTLDHEGYVTRWNDRAEDVLGHSVEDSLGTYLGALLSTDTTGKQCAEKLIESARTGGEVTAELEWERDDGSTFTAPTTVVASYTSEGTRRGFGVVLSSADAPTTPS